MRSIPRAVVDRIIVVDSGSNDATTALARRAGADIIDVGPAMGAPVSRQQKPPRTPTSWCSWTAMVPTTPASIAALDRRRSVPAIMTLSSARAVRGGREPGSMAWHQMAPACWQGWGCGCFTACATPTCAPFARSGAMRCCKLGMRELTYGWNIEMQMRAARSGLRVLEIPVPYHRRIGGTSKVAGSLRGSIRAGARIIATFVRVSTQSKRERPPG